LKVSAIDKRSGWHATVPAPNPFPATFDPKKDYFATLHTSKGDITVKFFPDVAPRHVTSFIYLSEIGYYDDAPFHRVCQNFMMQGGDPTGTGMGGPGYRVPAEFNARKHVKGVLSAARSRDPDSAGSQFFLMFTAYPSLDNSYTVFGEVSEGMDIVDKFHDEVAVPSAGNACPPRSKEKINAVSVFTRDKKS
jgi:cyclophilin family peptidyl-prolyl cis-trans isomerase